MYSIHNRDGFENSEICKKQNLIESGNIERKTWEAL